MNDRTAPTFASFYDFYDAAEARGPQLRMYRDLAAETGSPVLELGSGTGTILIDLARAGPTVTGLELNPDMLALTEERLASEPNDVHARVRLVQGDMARFSIDARFAAVLIASNLFGCLRERADQRRCLECVRTHLQVGGSLVIEERHFTPDALVRMAEHAGIVKQQAAGIYARTGRYTTYNAVTRSVDFVSQTVYGRSFVEEVQEDGSLRRYVPEGAPGTGRYYWDARRYFSRFELELLLEAAGFEIEHVWGGHDRRPLSASSYSMIVIARLKA